MRDVVVKVLARLATTSLQARKGREALRVFQAHRDQIRLVLLDLTMPGLDGEETCRELRQQGATVPVILTSGFPESDLAGRFQGLGPVAFIQKPFRLGSLAELVRKALEA